ncbi:YkgJ family cysteine cluster protein [Treponema primitia]|uniref:YkgJ family cysteine cluster protein n=1 Tax=Treponema primitia TaxID=88058 RepID=UPI00397FC640
MPVDRPFYAQGLRFSCARCSECCRIDPGFVFLRKKDTEILVSALKMKYTEFVEFYCRWVPDLDGVEQLSLKEKANFDCIFWKNGCSVYEARPLQCRTFPFWPSILQSTDSWEAMNCPGMRKGALHSMMEIESILTRQKAEPFIKRAVVFDKAIKKSGEI